MLAGVVSAKCYYVRGHFKEQLGYSTIGYEER